MAANFWENDSVVKGEDQWWSKDPEAGATKKEARKSTMGTELVRGGKQLASSVRTGAEALFGSPEEAAIAGVARGQAIGTEAGEGASLEAVKRAYQDKGLLSAAGEVVGQIPRALAGQVPQLAAMAGGAKLGAMAGTAVAPGPGTVIGGVLGAGATLLPQFFGANVERQAAEQMAKDQPVKIDRTAAGASAAGQAALEGAGTAFVLGKRIVKGVLGVADDAALATAKAQQAMTQAAERSVAAAAGRGVVKGAATEIPVEIAQTVLERAQAGLDVTSPEALSEYGEVAYQAGLIGGAIGGGAGPLDTAMARQGVKARTAFQEAEAKRAADEATAKQAPAQPSPTQIIEDQAAELERGQQRREAEPEPYVKPPSISETKPDVLLGEREDPLAGVVTGKREAAEPAAEIPLGDDYAFLQREKQRLMQEEQTPQTKQLLGRINDQIGEVLKRDIERLRTESETLKRNREADAEATKTSVFGQEELPPVESRDVVLGSMELEKLQAREEPPAYPLTAREAKRVGEMEGLPQPMIPEVEAEIGKLTKDQELAIAEREKLAKRTSGTSLSQVLRGTLRDTELSELGGRARQVGKNPFLNLKAPKGQAGSSMEDMVDTGKLDIFLPVKMRPGNPDYVNSESAEYIRDKLRNNQPYTYETELAIQRVDNDIESIERQIQDLLSDDEINKELQYAANEQRKLDQTSQEFAPAEADRTPEQREAEKADADLDKRQAQLDREAELNQREARLLEERKRLEEERLKLERPTKEQVVKEEERKAKAPELEEREQIRKESEAGAGQFELTREEGRQDTTGDIFKQPEPEVAAISPEQERKEALENFALKLKFPILPFRARSANKTQILRPVDLTSAQIKEISGLASEALDLGLPALALGNVTAAGSTRMDVVAVMSSGGSLMIAKKWKDSSKAEKLHTLIHELAHAVDTEGGKPSNSANWAKAHAELQNWYNNSPNKFQNPFAYPFAPQFRGRVRPKEESFAQAFAHYFVSPVDLQTNAPEAYSQIQSIVERIQNGSQAARAAGTTKTSTAGIKIQLARTAAGAAVQPAVGAERTGVSPASRLGDRGAGEVTKPSTVTFYEDIPNESWLQGKIDYAMESPRNKFGVPKMSSTTGYFKEPVMVPTRWFEDVKGQRGEQQNVRKNDLEAIRKIIRDTGKFPIEDGKEYVPYIEIGYDGKPWISEGNHRIMAAIAEGLEYIPIQLRYFDGGQRRAGKWNPENIKEITERVGVSDQEAQDINFSLQNIKGQPVLAQWTTPTDTKLYGETTKDDVIYSLQNKMIDTKRVVDAISATAGKILAKWNPYLQEELFHGRTAKQTADFLKKELRPLMQDMSARGVSIEEFEKYLHNRHAEDYNKHVAKIGGMPDGGSGLKTADARAYLASLTPQQKADFEALAKKMDAINKNTREILVKSGMETRDTIEQWEKTFPYYVPLKRDESKLDYAYTAGGLGTGQGFDVRGKFSQAATGSEKDVVNILANSAMQRERAIVKSEKNRVAQAMFGLAVQSPNPDFWLPIDPMAEVDPEAAQDLLSFGLSQEDLDFLMKEPRQKAVDKKSGEIVERINATLRKNENVMSMRFNGRDRYVFFNPSDPRAKRMVASLKNMDADQLGYILGNISKITRWFAAVNTQYNPIFGAYNFLRDVQGAALQLSDTPLARDRKAVVAGTLPALKGIYSALRAERDGEAVDGSWAKLWNEFQEQGGQTGFRDQFSRSQERAEALEKELKMVTEGKLKAAGRATLDWLSDYNDAMENSVRLSAYKAALDKGIGKEEAASIAKNLTVNFNRKGQIAAQAGALYAFFNAAVQGTTRLAQTLRGPAGKKIMAGGFLLGTMQAALLAAAGFDDEEPPEFVRERNLILPIGGDKYLTFPMPLGYHVIPSTSRIITEWALSGFKNTPDRIASLTGMFLEAFNPIGNAGWSAQTLAPTFADPIVALTENRDWTGKPIARKDFSNLDPTPGYTRAKDTASEFSTQIAKFLNYASGGTEFKPGVLSPTPDQIDYLIGQGTGGIGRELLKAEQTALKTASGEELPPYKIPVVGRFYGETKSSAAESGRFYKNLTKLNEHENEIKGRRESKQPIADYIAENPESRLAPMGRKVYADIQKLRKRKEQLVERDAPRESVQAVEKMITARMKTLNDRVASFEK